MSDRFGLKVKENAGKTKYSSLNLNQTYKGTKVETKTSSGLYFFAIVGILLFNLKVLSASYIQVATLHRSKP